MRLVGAVVCGDDAAMKDPAQFVRHVVGVMTGTSIDGIDAALVRLSGQGLEMDATLVRHRSDSLGAIRTDLRRAAAQEPMSAGEFATLSWRFGELHAEVIERLLMNPPSPEGGGKGVGKAHDVQRVIHPHPDSPPQRGREQSADLIAVHGQTVFHRPPVSWQLINPAPIVARFDCPVIFDLRQADLAAGGQGAPITPLADWILFRAEAASRAILNLGGYCNITIIPRQRAAASSAPGAAASVLQAIRGFDVCACNHVLDAVARRVLIASFDDRGTAALAGRAQPHAAEALRTVLGGQRTGGRSLGTGDEASAWIERFLHEIAPNDLAASAVEAIASCIVEAISPHDVDAIILAGGGARNAALVNAIRRKSGTDAQLSDAFGVPIEAREAMAIAILGALCMDGEPMTLPQVTGCASPPPISGMICPAPLPARRINPTEGNPAPG